MHSQGRTHTQARASVIDALRGMLELRFGAGPSGEAAVDSESLELVIARFGLDKIIRDVQHLETGC